MSLQEGHHRDIYKSGSPPKLDVPDAVLQPDLEKTANWATNFTARKKYRTMALELLRYSLREGGGGRAR